MRAASRAFCLALLKDTITIEAKRPMMAITTKSSIKVKPCLPAGRLFLIFILTSIPHKTKTQHQAGVFVLLQEEDLVTTDNYTTTRGVIYVRRTNTQGARANLKIGADFIVLGRSASGCHITLTY